MPRTGKGTAPITHTLALSDLSAAGRGKGFIQVGEVYKMELTV